MVTLGALLPLLPDERVSAAKPPGIPAVTLSPLDEQSYLLTEHRTRHWSAELTRQADAGHKVADIGVAKQDGGSDRMEEGCK